MCYQIVELYSACHCPYYRHAPDKCASYGRPGHPIQQRTIYVGYNCQAHTPVRGSYADGEKERRRAREPSPSSRTGRDLPRTKPPVDRNRLPRRSERIPPSRLRRLRQRSDEPVAPKPMQNSVPSSDGSDRSDSGSSPLAPKSPRRRPLGSYGRKTISKLESTDDDDVDCDETSSTAETVAPSSILSLPTTASTALTAMSEGEGDTISRLFKDLLNDPELEHLFPQLVRQSSSRSAAEKHITRLLRRFAQDLMMRSSNKVEADASRFVRSCSDGIACRVVECHKLEMEGEEWDEMEVGLEEAVVELSLLAQNGATEDEEEARVSVRAYEELREFLFENQPFESLKMNIRLFVGKQCPSDPGRWFLEKARNELVNRYDSLISEVLKPGIKKKRLWWNCECGRKLYDDYEELRPGALEDLRVFLLEYGSSSSSSVSTPPSSNSEQTSNQASTTPIRHALRGFSSWAEGYLDNILNNRPPRLRQGMPDVELADCPYSSVVGVPEQSRHKFLLLCIPFMRWGIKLRQPDVCKIHSDRDFFRLLKAAYLEHRAGRRWKWLRDISQMEFVQFEMFPSDLVNIRLSPSMPSLDERHNYDCELPDTNPPIGPNMAMHLLENPEHAPVLPILFRRVPVKRRVRLEPCPVKGSSQGWGVQFIESVNPLAVLCCGFVGFVLCLVTSVSWTAIRGDVQGGFGIGAFVLTFSLFCTTKLHLIA